MDCLCVVYQQVSKYREGEYFHKRSILMFSLLRFLSFYGLLDWSLKNTLLYTLAEIWLCSDW